MALAGIFLLLTAPLIVQDRPLPPAWSPDHRTLAATRVPMAFATPEGANYSLLLNGALAYPQKRKHGWFAGYDNWHTFLTDLVWSPDSERVAFVEKVYDWEYLDPYNRDFEGTASNKQYYLTIVSRDGRVSRYQLHQLEPTMLLSWINPEKLVLNSRSFDLQANPPQRVP